MNQSVNQKPIITTVSMYFTRNKDQSHPKMQFDYLPQQTFHDETKKRFLQQHDQDVFELQYFHVNLVMPFWYVHYLVLKPIQLPTTNYVTHKL